MTISYLPLFLEMFSGNNLLTIVYTALEQRAGRFVKQFCFLAYDTGNVTVHIYTRYG